MHCMGLPMRRAALFASFLAVSTIFVGRTACADDEKPAATDASPKRSVPDYSGRGRPSNGDDAGVWLLRVLLSPLYFVSEYVIRKPLDGLFDFLETNDRLTKLYDFFAFGPDHKMGFAPVGFVEFGFNPSLGIYGFWNTKNNAVHMHIEVWPPDWLAATFEDRYTWGDDQVFDVRAVGVNRPDQVFYGIGPDSAQHAQSRYREARTDATATLDAHVWRSSRVRAWGGIRKVDLSDGHFGSDPSVSAEARAGGFPAGQGVPFGFDRGYVDPNGGVAAAFDTRAPEDPRSGLRLEVEGDLGSDVEHSSSGWAHWGGVASGFWDLDGHRRILSLSAGASFADQLGPDPIPFTELVSLGGDKWMTGYFPGRLRGASSATAMLRYDWPIASWIDGTLQGVVGNVFDEHLQGFSPGELRFSGAIGITTNTEVIAAFAGASSGKPKPRVSSAGPRLEVIAGFGTDTFDRGATVQSFHIAFGVPHDF